MKILVLQLARLGDIYQSWPALRALRRSYPNAQIDILVRPKFESALIGLSAISNCLLFSTEEIVKPLLNTDPDIAKSLSQVDQLISNLKNQKFDKIINLSFSPLSSYLVHALSDSKTEISGYTRHKDGFFDIAGEISSYFYAQVGIGRFNRFHLTDLMAGVMGVEITNEDWNQPTLAQKEFNLPENYVVIHVGSSEAQKSLPAFRWARILNYFHEVSPEFPVVLIGSSAELSISDLIIQACPKLKIINLVGKTSISDLFQILKDSRLLIGCDSAPMHVAGFTKTPCLNLSIGRVNFWETGPRSPRSFIFRTESVEQIFSEDIGQVMKEILEGRDPVGLIKYIQESPCYLLEESAEQKFGWELILALYMGHPFPPTEDLHFFQGCQQLSEINDVIIENLEKVSATNLERLKPVLDRSDEVIHKMADIVPLLRIYANWLKTERLRVKPGSITETLKATLKMHITLKTLIRPYILDEKGLQAGEAHG